MLDVSQTLRCTPSLSEIFSADPDEMQNNFLRYNPGLERRITHTFDFDNMTPQDLAALALMNMQRMQGWEIDVADLAALTTRMADLNDYVTLLDVP